ncbi:sigma-70 family RNA polymerase sigma factor [bacterium]|nr:sigma-70 family RNA polymerase sigma factor [bacterium]
MPNSLRPREYFATTHWTIVLTAGRRDTSRARDALAQLCQTYWYPLYAYVRRRGYSPQDAEDLTQGFFARLLELDSLAAVAREKGRFRAFLLASMNHYLADEWDRASAQKRDARRTISLDALDAETRYAREPVDTVTPERLFERRWALTLLETVLHRLKKEYEAAGKRELFQQLRFAITGDKNAVPYADLAARLGMTGEAVRVAVHRLRRRYRQVLREEIAQTVTSPEEVKEELRALFASLR